MSTLARLGNLSAPLTGTVLPPTRYYRCIQPTAARPHASSPRGLGLGYERAPAGLSTFSISMSQGRPHDGRLASFLTQREKELQTREWGGGMSSTWKLKSGNRSGAAVSSRRSLGAGCRILVVRYRRRCILSMGGRFGSGGIWSALVPSCDSSVAENRHCMGAERSQGAGGQRSGWGAME